VAPRPKTRASDGSSLSCATKCAQVSSSELDFPFRFDIAVARNLFDFGIDQYQKGN
jgi:hypothetical protein